MDRHNNQEGRDAAREGRDINSDNLIHFPGGEIGELPGGGTPASSSDEVMRRFCLDNPGAPNCKKSLSMKKILVRFYCRQQRCLLLL